MANFEEASAFGIQLCYASYKTLLEAYFILTNCLNNSKHTCFGIAWLDCKIIWSGTEYCLEILEKLKIHCFLNLPTNNCSVTYCLIERFLRHRFASATSKVKLGLYFVDRKSK